MAAEKSQAQPSRNTLRRFAAVTVSPDEILKRSRLDSRFVYYINYSSSMTPRPKAENPKSTVLTLRVANDMLTHLRRIQELDGVPLSEQIRRGIGLWLKSKGVSDDTAKRRAPTRRKALRKLLTEQ